MTLLCKECKKKASHGYKNKPSDYCVTHKKPNMVNTRHTICNHKDCLTKGSFSNKLDDDIRYCNTHKINNMKNYHDAHCYKKGCKKTGTYGYPGEPRISCPEHKLDKMVKKEIVYKYNITECIYPWCRKDANYAFSKEDPLRYCFAHKDPLMLNIMTPKCYKCNTRAEFGYSHNKRISCSKHKLPDMTCQFIHSIICSGITKDGKKCSKSGTCGYTKKDDILYCAEHKKPDMKNVKNKRCAHPKCENHPSFNVKGSTTVLYCSIHKTADMVDVKNKRCIEKDCDQSAHYGIRDGPLLYCNQHKKENMINIDKTFCKEPGCETSASFNFIGQTKMLYCAKHKKPDMINMNSKKCKYADCQKTPKYGIKDGTVYEYCSEHKIPGMVRLNKELCKHENCDIGASYGTPGGHAEYCASHKLDGQINLKLKRCELCDVTAAFNFPGKPAIRCVTHADDGMINVNTRRCQNCNTTSSYGIPGNLSTHCAKHKTENMINSPTKKCIHDKCREIALYGINNQIHCEAHKLETEHNLVEKKCKSCKLTTILNIKNMCGYCDPTMIKSLRLVRQEEVKKLFDTSNLKYKYYDQIIDSKCGRERPDFVFDCNDHFVVVEVDENQHNAPSYKPINQKDILDINNNFDCETVRMINISQTLGLKTIFIRYNPDSFRVDNKIQLVSKTVKHKQLCDYVKYMIEKKDKDIEFLSVLYLYYDNYDKTDIKLQTIIKNN